MDDMGKFKVFMGALIACNIILLVLVIIFVGGGSGDALKNPAQLEARLESLENRMAKVESDREKIAGLIQQNESLETMPSLASESVQELASRIQAVEKNLAALQDQAAARKERADQEASISEKSAGETSSPASAEAKQPVVTKKSPAPAPAKASGEAVLLPANAPAAYCTVKEGDTLYSIGQRHGVKPETLRRLNGLDSNTIQVGQRLRIQ